MVQMIDLWVFVEKATRNIRSNATENYMRAYNGLLIDYQLNDFQGAFICGLIASIDLSLVGMEMKILAFQDNTIFQTKALA